MTIVDNDDSSVSNERLDVFDYYENFYNLFFFIVCLVGINMVPPMGPLISKMLLFVSHE
jgi:hypothetical protein